ncbi:MAG: hypothetical protein HON14_01580 [Rhodospirillaceae bacterium]|jgi:hypothetical protein|nr:hypothetical protein [Rhodospirillaceae bacterium]MBT4937793.1 hypothetical protein [Rhodospirillaceae bacterium]MBT5938986.1 hypothetical protein [Rhodospirillaceae bacterium]MBT7267959.1 hypothetical protein [Rhodospirillaceae bacterium]
MTETEINDDVISKDDWPKTEHGTVNWEIVFESPENGLLTLIGEARTPKALLESSIVIIQKIYTRKDDPAKVEQFIQELSELIPEDLPEESLADIIEVVTTLLRQIKDFRIQKAQEHIDKITAEKIIAAATNARENQAERRVAKDRRKSERRDSKSFGEYRKASSRGRKTNPVKTYGIIFGLMAVAAIAMYIFSGVKLPQNEQTMGGVLMQEINQAALTKKGGKHVFGGDIRVDTFKDKTRVNITGVPRSQCFRLVRTLQRRGEVYVNGTLARQMKVAQIKDKCSDSGTFSDLTFAPIE